MLLSRSVPLFRRALAPRRDPVRGDRPALVAALGVLAASALAAGATVAAVEAIAVAPVDPDAPADPSAEVAAPPAAAVAPEPPAPKPGAGAETAPDGRPRVDVNRASQEELTRIPGIGPATARRIVELREQRGPFRDVDELLKVRGIGEKTLEKIRPWVRAVAAG